MKNKIFKTLVILALFLTSAIAAKATDTKASDSVYVAKDEIISGNFYAVGQTITVDGVIGGDLIAAAQTINVNGRIDGDIIAAGQDITINGEVGGNIRIAGSSLVINGSVVRNVNAFGANIILGSESSVGWDVYLAGANAELRGVINGGLSGNIGQSLITGTIGKNVNLKLPSGNTSQKLIITNEAVINGNLSYKSKNDAQISEKATIAGEIQKTENKQPQKNWFLVWLWSKIFSIFSALVVGLVLIFLGKTITPKILKKIEERPTKLLIPGLIFMFVVPPAAIVLAFTLIGIPLAIIIGLLWVVSLYIAKILTAILVGELLITKVFKKKISSLMWPLALGVSLCWLFFSIPFIGWVFGLIATWLGLGAIWAHSSNQFKNL
ncbi:MAG: hypothetical protein WC146_02865 [Patescibacteria group bacterium]